MNKVDCHTFSEKKWSQTEIKRVPFKDIYVKPPGALFKDFYAFGLLKRENATPTSMKMPLSINIRGTLEDHPNRVWNKATTL